MSKKFKVIKNTDKEREKIERVKRVILLSQLWEKQYTNAVTTAVEKNKGIKVPEYSQEELKKIALNGIKYLCAVCDVMNENEKLKNGYESSLTVSKEMFQFINGIFNVCGCLTLRNFVNTFPITKKYDGAKHMNKDYFSTMDVLSEMDWDKPIGENNIPELLWDYQNEDLCRGYHQYMLSMSDLYKAQTGKGIAEQWCEENNIGTYTVNQEMGIIRNNQTGEISKISDRPSHLQIVK